MPYTPNAVSATTSDFQVPHELLANFSGSIQRVYETLGSLFGERYTNCPEARKLSGSVRSLTSKTTHTLKAMCKDSEENIRKLAETITLVTGAADNEESVQALILQVGDTLCFVRERACTRNTARFNSIKTDVAKIEDHLVPTATDILSLRLEALKEQITDISEGRELAADSNVLWGINTGDEEANTVIDILRTVMASVRSSKANQKLDNTISTIEQSQQVCLEEMKIVKQFHVGSKKIWAELDACDEWWLTMNEMLHLPDVALSFLTRTRSCPNHVKMDLRTRLTAIMNTEEKYRDALKSLLGNAPSFPTLYIEDLNNERSLKGEVQVFEGHIQYLVPLLKKLSTARHMVRQNQEGSFVVKLYELQKCLHQELLAIQDVFEQWRFYLKQRSTGSLPFVPKISSMMDGNDKFTWEIQPILIEISSILNAYIDKRSVKNSRLGPKAAAIAGMRLQAVSRIGSKSEALETWDKLSATLKIITRFATRLGTALLHHDRRPQGARQPGGLTEAELETTSVPKDPFDIEQNVIDSALTTLKHQTIKLDVSFQPSVFKKAA